MFKCYKVVRKVGKKRKSAVITARKFVRTYSKIDIVDMSFAFNKKHLAVSFMQSNIPWIPNGLEIWLAECAWMLPMDIRAVGCGHDDLDYFWTNQGYYSWITPRGTVVAFDLRLVKRLGYSNFSPTLNRASG